MKRLLFGFIILFCFPYANAQNISELYLGSREADPASLVENVSTIHGDYTEVEVDLVVPAPDSLILSRFYSSRDTVQIAKLGGWRFNPHCFLTMQKDPKGKTYSSAEGTFERTYVYVGNPDGSILTYVGWQNTTNPSKPVLFKIDSEEEGLANTAKGNIGAWTNLKNNELYYHPQTDSFELLLCSEGKRFYVKNSSDACYCITHEILPSGNKIFYEFDDKNQLILIKETNAAEKKELAWIKLQYENGIHLQTSDGQTVEYQFEQDSSGIQLLTSVARSNKPDLHYQYKVIDNHALLVKKTLPEGRFVQVDYYLGYYLGKSYGKVSSIITPNSTGTSKTQFIYNKNCTVVSGPWSQRVEYFFNKNLQLIKIEECRDSYSYRIHRKSWSNAGNLTSTSIADKNGKVFYHKYFIYDNKGNITEEHEYGDVAGNGPMVLDIDENGLVSNQIGRIKNCSYFSDKNTHGFFQRDAKGAGVKYWYKKGTNLLIKKLILTNGSLDSETEDCQSGIKQRFFYTYNEDATLVQVIIDDGGEAEKEDFYDVTERKITYIAPKQEMPNVGAPEVIEQKYSSSDGKTEYLLKKTINHFDIQGNITSQEIYDANETYRYTINKEYAHGLLIFETDPMGNETHYSYDANQNLLSETHSDTGISIEYVYDLSNRLVSINEKNKTGNLSKTQIAYDRAGYKCKVVDRFGNQTIYENDSLGRPSRITYPVTSGGLVHPSMKPTYTYTYDIFDNLIKILEPRGRTLKKSYNIKGQPTTVHHLDGTTEGFRYDSGGNLHRHYRRDGTLEVLEYDCMGRLSKVEHYQRGSHNPSVKETSYQYNAFHKTSETDAKMQKTTYAYDGAGRLITLQKENQKIEFIYDPLGRTQGIKKWKSSKDFTLEIKDYDLLNRVIEERIENSSGDTLVKRKFIYNDAGELAQIIGYPQNQESILMQYEYDGFGRLSKSTNATGSVTQIVYDDTYVNDRGLKSYKRTLIDPMGNQTEEIFDNDSHLIQVRKKDKSSKLISHIDAIYDSGNKVRENAKVLSSNNPQNYAIEYSYNDRDQLKIITRGKSKRMTRFEYNSLGELVKYNSGYQEPITYQYDNYGNLEIVTYKEDEKEIKLQYDYNNNLTSMTQDNFSLNYVYDENDLPISETVEDEFGSYQVNRIYNGEGKVQTLTFPNGSYVEYTYDGPLVKNISRFGKDKKELYTHKITARDQMGNILEEILPGDLDKRTQTWDEAGRRIEIATNFFQDKVLEYDSLNNIKKRETALEEESIISEYVYNALLQLISEKGHIEHNYSYDSIGNRLKKDDASYKINDLNELLEAGNSKYTFYYNGTIATKTVNKITRTYQSNLLNQITSIKDADQTVTFTYDLTGKRLSKRIDAKGKESKILRFFYLDDTEIGCVDEKGVILELKIPSNPNNPEAPCIAIELKNEVYVPLYDLQGNITCLLDPQTRKVIESYRYSAFGEEEIINQKSEIVSDSSIGNPWRYRGKRVDTEIGLIYFGHRYYDPEIGRWISPDPLGTIDGPNLYAYAHNNPMTYIDYFGLSSDINENQSCVCAHCVRGEGLCHCLGNGPEFDAHRCVCIGISCNHKITRVGSSISSAIGGISHGVIDFVVGSLHDLQSAAVYMGSQELEMTLHERTAMIEAVEQSQMQQLATLGSHFMDMLSIDGSDASYQSFRSKTRFGLEVGSLVAGGYGAIKGVIVFARLAKAPIHIAKIANKSSHTDLLKAKNIIEKLETFLCKDSKIFKNKYGDIFIESKDGLRQFRMDLNHPAPHKNPHAHLIEFKMKGNKKVQKINKRIYPNDVTPE